MRPFPGLAAPVCSAAALVVLGGLSLRGSSAAPASAPPPTAAAPSIQVGRLVKGTPVRVRLQTELRSGQCKVGDPVAFTVAQDVFGPGGVRLLAAGAAGVGHVTDSAGHHSFGRAGRLAFTCDAVFAGGGALRVPLTLSVRPKAKVDPPARPPAPAPPPPNDLHTASPVVGDVLADTPLSLGGRASRSTSGTFSMDSGPDVAAGAGDEFDASVAADTPVPVLPPPPGGVVVVPPGAVKIEAGNVDAALPGTDQDVALLRAVVASRLKAGFSVVKMPDGSVVMTPPRGSMDAPITLPATKGASPAP